MLRRLSALRSREHVSAWQRNSRCSGALNARRSRCTPAAASELHSDSGAPWQGHSKERATPDSTYWRSWQAAGPASVRIQPGHALAVWLSSAEGEAAPPSLPSPRDGRTTRPARQRTLRVSAARCSQQRYLRATKRAERATGGAERPALLRTPTAKARRERGRD